MGISRDSRHKRRETGGKRKQFRKKRKFELGRQPANTKLGGKRVHTVRVRGGHLKFRALHLETGNFSWGTEVCARKTRILDVVYNASNNELVRTKTLVKGAVVLVDATPFRQWYDAHYGVKIGIKKNAPQHEEEEVKKSDHVLRKLANRQRTRVLDPKIDEQVTSGRLLAVISSRPGQSGRADGYILEGKELEFYQRKLATKKSKKGRGNAAGGRGKASGRGRSSHLRNLGSNAFRFEEREEQDDSEVAVQGDYGSRTQFFASEQKYRGHMGAAPGEHFQSRTMKQWEEKDDAEDGQGAIGVLIDLPFEPQDENDEDSKEEVAEIKTNAAVPVAAAPTPAPSKTAQGDAELDFLLNLSVSTSNEAKSTPTPSMPVDPVPASTRTPTETEQLEDWLDDVLDM
ncbi:Ribosomal protein S8e/ribosomal biogenesis NSA2 [Phytophthora cactorum]|nr:Ribosomal protein S8e/ribosomal biogenesis NSA2 [Phytophthora cactorum]